MKFSFEGEKYRKDLADKLREEKAQDSSVAKETLQREKGTLKYEVSRSQKQIKRGELRQEKERESQRSWEIIDIENRIPEDIKLAIDKARIAFTSTSFGSKSFDELFKDIPELRARLRALCDELSNGEYSDSRHANHTILTYGIGSKHDFIKRMRGESPEFLDDEVEQNRGSLWFAIGESYWFKQPWQQILIFSPENSNYKELLEGIILTIAREKLKWISNDDITQLGKEGIKSKVFERLRTAVDKLLEDGRLSYKKLGKSTIHDNDYYENLIIYFCLLNEIPVDGVPNEVGLQLPTQKLRSVAYEKRIPFTWASLSNVAIDLAAGKMYKHKKKIEKQESSGLI